MHKQKLKKGDVYTVALTQGKGLIQCVNVGSATELDIIRVIPGIYYEIDIDTLPDVVRQKELFFTQVPIEYAVTDGLISFVGNFRIPKGSKAPRYYRDRHTDRREFLGWHIVDSRSLKRRFVKALTPKEQTLSPWGTISLPLLVGSIENAWTPTNWVDNTPEFQMPSHVEEESKKPQMNN